ncbi:glutathione S-transferase T3-like [Helianthus annuus]|uniref:glutathione S-transferase T3-like n=1 Tax=Helianthus annuus TaxID=4232 RepID=UPI000B8EEF1D|nr:glutathione S-transferase T3-like [Helianthus annuus]
MKTPPKKKMTLGGKKAKMERQSWSKYQEEALAKAWVHCTTDKKKGNQQTCDGFWRSILDHYNVTVGGSNRTVHQVRSNWIPMMTKINHFNSLYQQADRTRDSGCDDLDVMKIALKDFQNKYPSGFQHVEAWEVVRKHDKWAQVPLLSEEGEGSAQKRKSVNKDPSIPDMKKTPRHKEHNGETSVKRHRPRARLSWRHNSKNTPP